MERLKNAARFIQGFVYNMGKKHMSAYAAQAAYFIILSFIPFQTPLTKNNLLAITIFHNTIIFLFMPNIASLQQR